MHRQCRKHVVSWQLSVPYAFGVMCALLCLFVSVPLAEAQNDWVKAAFQRGLAGFQGDIGDGVVIASLVGMLIALLRRSFKTALGFLVVVGGIVILRILIEFLFGA